MTAFAKGGVLVAIVLVMLLLRHHEPRQILSEEDRAHARALRAIWDAESRVARCPRSHEHGWSHLIDHDARPCMRAVVSLRDEMVVPCEREPCPRIPLAALRPHPEVIAACASVYRHIEEGDVCSTLESVWDFHVETPVVNFPDAVRVQIVPLVAAGDVGAAAAKVLDAMYRTADFGRHSMPSGSFIAMAQLDLLGHTLHELLIDPRLSRRDARLITHGLDLLVTRVPRFQDMLRASAIDVAFGPMPEDEDQDLTVLIAERRLQRFAEACATAAPEDCARRLLAYEQHPFDERDRWLSTPLPEDAIRDRVIEARLGLAGFTHDGAAFARRDRHLRVLRDRAHARE